MSEALSEFSGRASLLLSSRAFAVLGPARFQLTVVTPVVLAAGLASVAAFVVITLQDLIVALLGARLIRGP